MTTRQRDKLEYWHQVLHEELIEEWVRENPTAGCLDCQKDFPGFAEDRLCTECGKPIQDYDKQTMREIAEEYV